MTLGKFLPVPIIVGILAAISVILANAIGVPVWPVFITWGLYFIAGAKPSRLPKEILGLTGGILFGYATILAVPVYGAIFGTTWGLPLAVATAAFIIVLLELTDWFELAPAYFMAYAGYFAYVFGKFGGPGTTPENALIPFWALTMAGLVFGYVNATLRRKVLEKEGIYGAAQETVFDKERQQSTL